MCVGLESCDDVVDVGQVAPGGGPGGIRLRERFFGGGRFVGFEEIEAPDDVEAVRVAEGHVGEQPLERHELDELLGTKLRALYQRKQARDLFDLEIALTRLPVEPQRIVAAFLEYMVRDGHPITRAQVEQNLALKMRDGAFLPDLSPLLSTGKAWNPIAAEALISHRLVTLLPGDPWKADDH